MDRGSRTRNERQKKRKGKKENNPRDSTQRYEMSPTTVPLPSSSSIVFYTREAHGGYGFTSHMSTGTPCEWYRRMRLVVEFHGSRFWMNGERGRWSEGADGWPLQNTLWMKGLSSGHVSPVCTVGWLSGGGGMMGSNAFPNVYAFSFWIPYTALCVEIPMDVNFPDAGSVADDGWHG